MAGGREYTFSTVMRRIEEATGAVVNFHDIAGITFSIPELRLDDDQAFHHGAYCRFAKLHGNQPACSRNKAASIALIHGRCDRGDTSPLCGTCPFGVWDAALPFMWEPVLLGVFYIGGFRTEQPLAAIRGRCFADEGIPRLETSAVPELLAFGRHLVREAGLIVGSWRRAGNHLSKQKPESFYIENTLAFVRSRYPYDVGIGDLAALLHVHPDYLGRLVKQIFGKTLARLLLEQRIEAARVMLRSTRHSVTRIAYAVGFNDGNYFSTVFRRETGFAPRDFRSTEKNS